jgi:hypothetical protein
MTGERGRGRPQAQRDIHSELIATADGTVVRTIYSLSGR